MGGDRQRALWAALLFRANQVVAVEDLVESAWDNPPASVCANVRTYIAALRTALCEAGEQDRLSTRPGGYLLHTAPDEVDLCAFDRLVTAGELAVREGQPRRAVEDLQKALALWRGQPLAGTEYGPLLRVEVARLEERRLLAAERYADAGLSAGRHADLVAELRGLVAGYPLREGLWARLMYALYASGRQADALAAYTQARRHLVDELGVEPGTELRATHQEILEGRAGARGAGPHSSNATVPVPALASALPHTAPEELPADVVAFAGRDDEVKLLSELLPAAPGGAAAVCAIDGAGGVGKSTLAIHVAHKVADRFPDGQLYVDLQGASTAARPRHPREVLARWLPMFGVPVGQVPTDTEDAAATFRSLTSGRRLLVVLDNAATAAQVGPLLPASPSCAALVTSRRALTTVTNARRLHLGVLGEDDAVALLGYLAGPERVAADPGAATRVVTTCGLLPLAVRIAGARLAARPAWPVRALADRLADAGRRLDELQVPDLAVRASFAVSYQDLPADRAGAVAARMFRVLGLLDTPDIGSDLAAALCDLSLECAETALERLADEHLVEPHAVGRYGMHDLLRLFAREHAEREEPVTERDAALARILDHQVTAARRVSLVLDPPSVRRFPHPPGSADSGRGVLTRAEAIGWVDIERVGLMALASRVARGTPTQQARLVDLAAAVYRPFEIRGYWHDLVTLNQLAARAAARLGDRLAEARACKDRGVACGRLGRADQELAHLERALSLYADENDPVGEFICLNWIGVSHGRQERYDLAVAYFEKSLAICRDLGDRPGQGHALGNLGIVYRLLGRHREAIDTHEQRLVIARECHDGYSEGVALGCLADSHRLAGKLDRAVAYYRESLTVTRQVGDRYGEATRLWSLGHAYRALGEAARARGCWRDALAVLQQLGVTSADEAHTLLHQHVPDTPRAIRVND